MIFSMNIVNIGCQYRRYWPQYRPVS